MMWLLAGALALALLGVILLVILINGAIRELNAWWGDRDGAPLADPKSIYRDVGRFFVEHDG